MCQDLPCNIPDVIFGRLIFYHVAIVDYIYETFVNPLIKNIEYKYYYFYFIFTGTDGSSRLPSKFFFLFLKKKNLLALKCKSLHVHKT